MEASLRAFAERGGIAVRYGSSWRSTRQDGDRLVLATDDGEYRCRAAALAGLAKFLPAGLLPQAFDTVPHGTSPLAQHFWKEHRQCCRWWP